MVWILNHGALLVLLLASHTSSIQGLIYGAPIEACRLMIPQHDYELPKMNPPPYNFSASIIKSNGTGSPIRFNVTLSGLRRETFMGFFIQARSITEDRADRIIGSFDPVKDSRVSSLIDCPDGINNSATHVTNAPIRAVSFIWNPPANFVGEFYFVATIVKEYKTYWIGVETPSFTIHHMMENKRSGCFRA